MIDQREAFERQFSDNYLYPKAIERSGDGYRLMQAQQAWKWWQSAIAHAVPQGSVVVPVEPTEAMIAAGYDASWEGDVTDEQMTDGIYRAMIAAAPDVPTESTHTANVSKNSQEIDRWIPISERLPEQDSYENGEELVYAARYGDGSYDLMNLSAIEGNQHAITHWFPIAAPVEAQEVKP